MPVSTTFSGFFILATSAGNVAQATPDHTTAKWVMQESGTTASLRGLHVVSSEVAWASGSDGTILRTTDGGRTWVSLSINHPGADGLDFRDIHAWSDQRAIVMSAGLPARFFLTTDSGETWAETYSNETAGVFFNSVQFTDGGLGVAFSDPLIDHLLVVVSVDRGETWTTLEREGSPATLSGEAGFAASGSCIALVTDTEGAHAWIGLGGDTGHSGARVLRTNDGRTWIASTTPLPASASAGIFSITFRDANHGVVVGGDYLNPDRADSTAAFTTDGGATWKAARTPPRGYRSSACWLPDSNTLVATGTNGTDISTDGGESWAALSDVGFHVVQPAPDGGTLWAAGANGAVARWSLKDVDGQADWKPIFNGRNLDGWTPKFSGYPLGDNFRNTFSVKDGVLRVSYDEWESFAGEFGHLFYEHEHAHYRLRFQYRFLGDQVPGAPGWAFRNSGIMLHGQSPETMGLDQDFPVSIEAQLLGGDGTNVRPTANVCTPGTHVEIDGELITRHCINSSSDTFHGNDWISVEIEVQGTDVIRHFVNDELVFEYHAPQLDPNDANARSLIEAKDGKLLLSRGTISLQAESHPCEFRRIEIRVLDEP